MMGKIIANNNSRLIFEISLWCYYLYRLTDDLYPPLGVSGKFEKLSILFSIICFFVNGKKSLKWVLLFSIIIPSTLYFLIAYKYHVITTFLLVFAAANLDSDHITKSLFRVNVFCLFLVFIFLLLGITENTEILREDIVDGRDYANTMGFYYYSGFSFRILCLTVIFLSLYRWSLTNLRLLIIIFINIVAFFLATTRLQLILSSLFIIFFIFSYKFEYFHFKSWFWKWTSIMIYPFMFVLYYVLAALSFTNLELVQELWDTLFSNRMGQSILAFTRYGINLFGNEIEMHGTRETSEYAVEYFYIDAGYAYWILAYGIIFTITILYCYSNVFYKSYKKGVGYIYIWLLLFSIGNLINDFVNFFASYPILLYLFARFNDDKQLPQRSAIKTNRK